MFRVRNLLPTSMKKVLGIDPSLTGTGISFRNGSVAYTERVQTELRDMRRLIYIRDRVREYAHHVKPDLIAYEGYAMGFGKGMAGKIFDRAELGGILKLMFIEEFDATVLVVPPNSLKLFMTGKGRLSKGDKGKKEFSEYASKHRGRGFMSFDEADAYGLMVMGEAKLDPRKLPRLRTHYQHVALAGCQIL